ncbi:hypothetical protein Pan258_54620 [Symmachiella dynata]|uniref:hypothetical protein n=1 Tax=Symmachiella dynata TaxID=2527995 RepID=UPI00118AE256|nr:hypothetical protein [Symmachiella dynata]QDT51373.1 hypothetical protein Pan258_54620 [Symmachiella dynata]
MTIVQTIYDLKNSRRVNIIQRPDQSYGFEEESLSDDSLEMCWFTVGKYSTSRCDTKERALAEALSRVSWLADVQ